MSFRFRHFNAFQSNRLTNYDVSFPTHCSEQPVDSQNPDESVGEISVQIDLFTHPGTGEHKVTVKGIDL